MAQRTFLQLVQQAYLEARIGGAVPSTVSGQVGRSADFVRWVLKAHEEIQDEHDDWKFDWATSSAAPFDLVAAQNAYDPAANFGVSGGIRSFFRKGAYVYDATAGSNPLASRVWLGYLEWETMRELLVPTVTGTMPTNFTLRPDGYVVYYPTPGRALKAVHEYTRLPETLVADGDIPRMPARYHDVIVWRAVMLYADGVKDYSRYDTAKGEYDTLMSNMEMSERPDIVIGGPLA